MSHADEVIRSWQKTFLRRPLQAILMLLILTLLRDLSSFCFLINHTNPRVSFCFFRYNLWMEEEQTRESEASISDYPGNWSIPIDLFVSKKHPRVTRGDIGFADSSSNVVYRITRQSPKSSPNYEKALFDATGNPLLSIYRTDKGRWECYKVDNNGDKDLVLRVKRTVKKLSRVELEVFLVADRSEDSSCDFKVKGCPFMKSCTIYNDSSLVAETSLMYKLHQIYVSRGKFRLTIFPGFMDNALIVALVVIFLKGRK